MTGNERQRAREREEWTDDRTKIVEKPRAIAVGVDPMVCRPEKAVSAPQLLCCPWHSARNENTPPRVFFSLGRLNATWPRDHVIDPDKQINDLFLGCFLTASPRWTIANARLVARLGQFISRGDERSPQLSASPAQQTLGTT